MGDTEALRFGGGFEPLLKEKIILATVSNHVLPLNDIWGMEMRENEILL